MKEKKPDYFILASWWLRPMPLGAILPRIRDYMEGLRSIHPVFRHWMIMNLDKRRYERLRPDWSDLEDAVYRVLSPGKDDIDVHRSLDKNGKLTPKSMSKIGFSTRFHTCHTHTGSQPPSTGQGGVKLSIDAGVFGIESRNGVVLELPTDQYGELHEPQMMRRLLDLTVQVWHPTSCEARSPDFIAACDEDEEKYLKRQVNAAWMNYIYFPPLHDCLPADLPCECEALPDGGSFFRLTPLRPDPDNPEHLERARRLQGIFESLHLCTSEYVLNDWPYDSAEIKYKAQITGAPEDVKYVVKMAIFDSYDAKRKVLLHAMLLNVADYALDVEKYDGARFPPGTYDIQINPCVVEARRQLDAVKMAGGGKDGEGDPIEWHIGIEDNACRLVAIFKLAGIDESRLRVRYTPFISNRDD